MPQDSIMDMVNNIESLYNLKMELFDRWMEEGDAWSKETAMEEATNLAGQFAASLSERYSRRAIVEAAGEMLEEFEEHREDTIREVARRERTPQAPQSMTPGEIEHAEKYEALARKLGIDQLRELIPASRERIQRAIETGDQHLNTIPLRKWDAAAAGIRVPGLGLMEKVCVLKHVAKWHYA